jgi:phosphoribosylglycinamide formyltransferase-1
MSARKARLVVLVSGNGTNLQAILDACASKKLPANVIFVVSSKRDAYAIERADQAGIPTLYHPWKWYRDTGRTRDEYDAALAEAIKPYRPDWIVLAGWMLVLGMNFLEQFPGHVINLHPALPGKFSGSNAIVRAFESYKRGEITETGLMIHLVADAGIDNGPVLSTAKVPIYPDDSLDTLTERMHDAEHILLVDTLEKLIAGLELSGT